VGLQPTFYLQQRLRIGVTRPPADEILNAAFRKWG
jgi:hypothetical protein